MQFVKNVIKRAFRNFLPPDNLIRKFPQNTMPLFIKLTFQYQAIDPGDLISFNRSDEYEEFWIIHGIAVCRHNKAVLLSGPSGIGKSSIMRRIIREGMAEPIDDGFILVGKKQGHYYVIQSGLYHTLKRIPLFAGWIRRMFRYKCPYISSDISRSEFDLASRKNIKLQNIAFYAGSVAAGDLSCKKFVPDITELAKLILVTHPWDQNHPRKFKGEKIETVMPDYLEREFNNGVVYETMRSDTPDLINVMSEKILNY